MKPTLPPFAAFLQFDTNSANQGLEKIRQGLSRLSPPPGALIALPELWARGIATADLREQCGQTPELIVALQKVARDYQCLLAGSLPEEEDGQVFNSLLLVDGDGVVGRHRKQHLFAPMGETIHFQAGPGPVPFSPSYPLLGGLVCFDLRFPELARTQAAWGTQLLVISAQWPQARIEHWRTLVTARAIENQLFVLACNRVGLQSCIEFGGHSLLVAPDGTILAQGDGREECCEGAHLDSGLLAEIRGRFSTVVSRQELRKTVLGADDHPEEL
ncbi:MAG: nitrilase-related carbon-nitrogen hydrolase [Thermodesulfobacteriota bacterium]